MEQYRHGDFMLEKVDEIPRGSKPRETRIFGEGEMQGHTHRVEGGCAAVLDAPDGEIYISVEEMTTLIHEEHQKMLRYVNGEAVVENRPIELPPGKYRVLKQREYDAYERAVRDVQD